MLSEEETTPNEKRRSLTFAEKFEVKFFFKAEAPREVAFSETSFTTGSESYYEDDDYWDHDNYYDEEEEYYDDDDDGQYFEDYYDEEEEEDDDDYDYDGYDYGYDHDQDKGYYQQERGYRSYTASEYDDYYHYSYNDYYNNGSNFSIRYTPEDNYHYDHHEEEEDEEDIRGRCRRNLFAALSLRSNTKEDCKSANERSTTRRLALAKLEKGLFRRQQQRDSETFSETEESEVSNSNSESDPFDEPLPPRISTTTTTGITNDHHFLNDLKRSNSSVTIKATFTTKDMPISIPIPNRSVFKVINHDVSEKFKPSSPSLLDNNEENPFSSLDDTILSCTPLTIVNKTPLRMNLSSSKDHVKELLKTSISTSSPLGKSKPFSVDYVPSINSNDLVKTMKNTSLLSTKKSTKNSMTTTTATINNLLSNLHNNTNSKGVNNKGIKKRSRSYSSPSSLQQLLPCY